ncbi:hypothetical protein [Rhodococcoides corynebacterioides]|uniref:Uncharacterized protein n=1 Tax=Rhodococcoides corynebacterioides TaxID=53972 RepID=A0ABS7P706_9NOCA|nr:hypothetical protein [Rhodococcus corynebacterioides]MBY6366936.1 hypothetical protein [Rhodococcus corynebacterioides]MBY6407738.1 hypothetical protein [Rhodococcus corynebacterioides]
MSSITTLDKDTVLARARAAIDTRTRYVEFLFDAAAAASAAHTAAEAARSAAADADTALAKAYKDAVDAGWTPAELKSAGLPAPASPRKPSRRASGRRIRPAIDTPADTAVGDGDGSTGAVDARAAGGAEVHQ